MRQAASLRDDANLVADANRPRRQNLSPQSPAVQQALDHRLPGYLLQVIARLAQADDLHRLETQQVHFGVARARPGPEQNQHGGKREAGEQRYEAQLPQQPLVIESARDRQQQASARHTLRKTGEQQRIAHRVAQRNHEDEARARQQQGRRQQERVATESAQAPPHMHEQKRQKERAHPPVEGALKALRPPHHEKRLQLTRSEEHTSELHSL